MKRVAEEKLGRKCRPQQSNEDVLLWILVAAFQTSKQHSKQKARAGVSAVVLRQKRFPPPIRIVIPPNQLHLIWIDFVMHVLYAHLARTHVAAAEPCASVGTIQKKTTWRCYSKRVAHRDL
jgi:hypothetical protein